MKTNPAFKRVIKKLSAVRATLRTDERQALDEILVDEVAAHKLNMGKATAKATGKAAGKASGKAQVKAHKLYQGKATGKAAGKAAGKAMGKTS